MARTGKPAPQPRAAVADPALNRPARIHGYVRPAGILKLDWNENTDPGLIGLVGDVLRTIPPEIVSTYPNLPPLYEKLAAHLDVAADRIAITAGSEGAIRQIFEAFVDPGDIVAVTQPTFGMYEVYARMFGAEIVPMAYQASDSGPALSAEAVIAIIRDRAPRLICLPNPDSPTGTAFPEDSLRAIIEAAGDTGSVISIDEAYFPFYQNTALRWVTEYGHLIVLRSTSKAWGLAGLRIGFAVSTPEITAAIQKVRAMFEINSLATEVFSAMLDRYDAVLAGVERLNEGKRFFRAEMERLGFRTYPCEGNFQHVAFAAGAEQVHKALKGTVLYRAAIDSPCLSGFSRFSATTVERFSPIVDAIAAATSNRTTTAAE
jgi:histidinol-phosphate aminotransferase